MVRIKLCRRLIPTTCAVFYEIAGTTGPIAAVKLIDSVGENFSFFLTPVSLALSGFVWCFIRQATLPEENLAAAVQNLTLQNPAEKIQNLAAAIQNLAVAVENLPVENPAVENLAASVENLAAAVRNLTVRNLTVQNLAAAVQNLAAAVQNLAAAVQNLAAAVQNLALAVQNPAVQNLAAAVQNLTQNPAVQNLATAVQNLAAAVQNLAVDDPAVEPGFLRRLYRTTLSYPKEALIPIQTLSSYRLLGSFDLEWRCYCV